jgi:outer membrane autotransporter protein
MKYFKIIALASLVAFQMTSAQQFNGDRKSYVSEVHSSSLIGLNIAGSTAHALRSEGGLSVSGMFSEYDSDSDTERQYEGDRETSGATFGYVHVLENVSLAASVTVFETETELEGTDTNGGTFESDGDGLVISLGAGSQFGDFSLSAVGGWGETSSDAERVGTFGLMEADFDTTFYYLEFALTYDWIVEEDYSIRPSAKLGYQAIETESFDEETAILLSDRTDFDNIEDEVLYVELAIIAEYYGFGQLVPFASVSIWQDLGESEVELEGETLSTLSSDVPDLFETVFSATVGVNFDINEQFSVGAAAEYFSGDELDGYNLGLSGNFTF